MTAQHTELVWECGPHANAWNGHDARCRQVRAPNPEPVACRSCGKSARACGKAPSFCCRDCAGTPGEAGTSFLTHEEADRG